MTTTNLWRVPLPQITTQIRITTIFELVNFFGRKIWEQNGVCTFFKFLFRYFTSVQRISPCNKDSRQSIVCSYAICHWFYLCFFNISTKIEVKTEQESKHVLLPSHEYANDLTEFCRTPTDGLGDYPAYAKFTPRGKRINLSVSENLLREKSW